jgi:hypothetical protein
MEGADGIDELGLLREIAAEIHRFVQTSPNHYAARALAQLVNREAEGEEIDPDERDLVLLTLLREAKVAARNRRFGH